MSVCTAEHRRRGSYLSPGVEPLLLFSLLCLFPGGLFLCQFPFVKARQELAVTEHDWQEFSGWRQRAQPEREADLRAASSNTISLICSRLARFFAATILWELVRTARLEGAMVQGSLRRTSAGLHTGPRDDTDVPIWTLWFAGGKTDGSSKERQGSQVMHALYLPAIRNRVIASSRSRDSCASPYLPSSTCCAPLNSAEMHC